MKKIIVVLGIMIFAINIFAESRQEAFKYNKLKPLTFESLEALIEQNKVLLLDFLVIAEDAKTPEALEELYRISLPKDSEKLLGYYEDYKDDKWFLFKFRAGGELNPDARWINISGIMVEHNGEIKIVETYNNYVSWPLTDETIDTEKIMRANMDSPYFQKYEVPYELIAEYRDILLIDLTVFLRQLLEAGSRGYDSILFDYYRHWPEYDKWDFIKEHKDKPLYYYELEGENAQHDYMEYGLIIDFDGKFLHVPFGTAVEDKNDLSGE